MLDTTRPEAPLGGMNVDTSAQHTTVQAGTKRKQTISQQRGTQGTSNATTQLRNGSTYCSVTLWRGNGTANQPTRGARRQPAVAATGAATRSRRAAGPRPLRPLQGGGGARVGPIWVGVGAVGLGLPCTARDGARRSGCSQLIRLAHSATARAQDAGHHGLNGALGQRLHGVAPLARGRLVLRRREAVGLLQAGRKHWPVVARLALAKLRRRGLLLLERRRRVRLRARLRLLLPLNHQAHARAQAGGVPRLGVHLRLVGVLHGRGIADGCACVCVLTAARGAALEESGHAGLVPIAVAATAALAKPFRATLGPLAGHTAKAAEVVLLLLLGLSTTVLLLLQHLLQRARQVVGGQGLDLERRRRGDARQAGERRHACHGRRRSKVRQAGLLAMRVAHGSARAGHGGGTWSLARSSMGLVVAGWWRWRSLGSGLRGLVEVEKSTAPLAARARASTSGWCCSGWDHRSGGCLAARAAGPLLLLVLLVLLVLRGVVVLVSAGQQHVLHRQLQRVAVEAEEGAEAHGTCRRGEAELRARAVHWGTRPTVSNAAFH